MKIGEEIKISKHFLERVVQRFTEEDLKYIEKVAKKAIEKATPGKKIIYTHPVYKITIVLRKMGRRGAELVTVWKN